MRRVVVTGSSSGVGAAIADRLAREGWAVVGVDRAPRADAGHLEQQVQLDLGDEAQTRSAMAELLGAEALVHAAGFMRTGDLSGLKVEDGDAMWRIHVRALIVMASVLCPAMPRGGRLIAIGSRTSAGAAGKSQYAACKAAVVGLVRSWAKEMAPVGVTANVIAPAAVATPMLTDPSRVGVPPVVPPIGRFIEAGEIAAYASFLLSPGAAAITGQELLICGGASL
jgi:NAD(P)-dependent dehydrogenase (short-subunit alcohol dehydrogenase family)